MRAYVRRFPVLALAFLALASCEDDPDPTQPDIGLPTSLTPVSVTTPKNTAIEATVPVSTIDGRALTYTVLTGPAHGTVELTELSTGVRVRYTPDTGFAGQDQVTFRVDDGVSTVDGEVNITVANAAPTASTVLLRRPALEPITFEVSGTDPDGDDLTFEVVDGPDGGTLSGFSSSAPGAGPSAQSQATT
ncbi:MAG: Ig-like domain-containing protein, partial [Longimicrobiales bacterium]